MAEPTAYDGQQDLRIETRGEAPAGRLLSIGRYSAATHEPPGRSNCKGAWGQLPALRSRSVVVDAAVGKEPATLSGKLGLREEFPFE